MVLSGIRTSIRLPSKKRNDNTLWYYEVFLFRFDYLRQKEMIIRYGIISFSHFKQLLEKEARTCMMFLGILINDSNELLE
jgi:hypothetical protein